MRERLLLVMMALCAFMLWMYYDLTKTNTGLLSGFVVLIGVSISHILNHADDILAALFKVGEVPKPVVPIPPATPVVAVKPSTVAAVPLIPPGALTVSLLILCILCAPCAFANTTITNNTTVVNTTVQPTAIVVKEKVQAGPMVDAPKLVRIYGDWYLGMEGGKDEVYTNTSKGWFGYAKVTYEGTLFTIFKSKNQDDD